MRQAKACVAGLVLVLPVEFLAVASAEVINKSSCPNTCLTLVHKTYTRRRGVALRGHVVQRHCRNLNTGVNAQATWRVVGGKREGV